MHEIFVSYQYQWSDTSHLHVTQINLTRSLPTQGNLLCLILT